MAVTTKKTFPATSNATTTVFSPVGIQLNNQDDLDVYVTLSGGTRVLQLRQSTGSTAQSSHPQVNNTDGLYYPAVSAGTTLYNYQLSTDNNTITFNSALPQGAVVFCERRTRDADGTYTTFASGSTIRATDLNNSARESNFTAQEARNKAFDLEGKIYNTLGQADLVVKTTDTGTVDSTMIADGTIVNADINASAAIDGTKISPNFGSQNIVTSGTVDGRDVSADGTKLDGIESGATADQTAAEIKSLYEGSSNTNAFTDTEKTKLSGIETGATADQTNAEIKTAYEANANTNEFSDAEQTKLAGIETAATADQTSAEIKTLLQSDKLSLSEMNTTSLDSRYFTETELNNGQLDNRYYTETEADGRFLRQDSTDVIDSAATWTIGNTHVATTGAIEARIVDLIDDVGGFDAIANETSFPATNPQGSTGQSAILSIAAVSTTLTPSNNTITIANGAGTGNTVTINNVTPSSIPTGFGLLVESTSTTHTYNFHRLVPKALDVNTVATNIGNVVACGNNLTDIENFADLYQISTSAPTTRADGTALTVGDLWFDSSSNQVMMVYDGSAGDGFSPITPDQSTITAINSVSGHVTFTEDLGLITNAVNTGSGNNSINTVGANIASVNTAATNIAKIQTVADDLNESTSEIDTVATNIANVNSVGNNISNVNAVHNNATNINAAVSNASNINAAVSNASNINTVAGNNTNINIVAGANSNINTVSGSISNVNTVGGAISNVNIVGNAISNVNNFANRYRIASSAPTSNLDEGDLYFDTTSNELRVYNGSAWQGGVTATGNLAGLGANTFTGVQSFISSQTFDGRDVSVDGAKLDGIEAGATGDQTASEIVSLLAGQTIAPNVITTTNLTLDFGTL